MTSPRPFQSDEYVKNANNKDQFKKSKKMVLNKQLWLNLTPKEQAIINIFEDSFKYNYEIKLKELPSFLNCRTKTEFKSWETTIKQCLIKKILFVRQTPKNYYFSLNPDFMNELLNKNEIEINYSFFE